MKTLYFKNKEYIVRKEEGPYIEVEGPDKRIMVFDKDTAEKFFSNKKKQQPKHIAEKKIAVTVPENNKEKTENNTTIEEYLKYVELIKNKARTRKKRKKKKIEKKEPQLSLFNFGGET